MHRALRMAARPLLSTSSVPENYRPDIDGLRAIAVSSVIAFHAFPGLLPGGFVGVDIFFVISGFLIGGLIARGARAGTFSFADFYARRARRIFPALALVLAATLAAGWWVLLPDEFASLGRHVIAGAGFVSNLLLWRESSYFDIDAARKPLLHLWSLGVEEQFYLLWPPLAILAFRLGVRLTALAIVTALASFIWSGFEAHRDLTADFFSPATRFWELMVGVLIAEATESLAPAPRRDNCLGVLGLALVAVSFWAVRADVRFPGFWRSYRSRARRWSLWRDPRRTRTVSSCRGDQWSISASSVIHSTSGTGRRSPSQTPFSPTGR